MATEVRYSEHGFFKATYHQRHHVLRLVFAIEQRLRRSAAKDAEPSGTITISPTEIELDLETREDVIAEVGPENSSTGIEDPIEGYIKQAKQIVTGDQFSQVSEEYLVDALRLACDAAPAWHSKISTRDTLRIERVRDALRLAKENRPFEQLLANEHHLFVEELRMHTAGFLAPLISTIHVGWPSSLLKSGIVLVDLPGVGIAQDSYRNITKQYVRDKARAVVLVVDRAGPTQESVELLRTSGYWDRLVGATDDPDSDPSIIIIAVTKVDDVAAEHWLNFAKEDRPKKRVVYDELVVEFKSRMRDQIRDQLLQFGSTTHEIVSEARNKARTRLLDTLEIHPVSAPEYRKIVLAAIMHPFDRIAVHIAAFA